jgi:hypothetical protein
MTGTAKISNQEIAARLPEIMRKHLKDQLLIEVEKELGLDPMALGYNSADGTFKKESMAEVLLGIWRLKGKI